MNKHTPGPWATSRLATPDYAPEFGIHAEDGASPNALAVVRGKADAALIAAAPELLEALRECITEDNACCMNTGQKSRRLQAIDAIARAAIARAEGGAA